MNSKVYLNPYPSTLLQSSPFSDIATGLNAWVSKRKPPYQATPSDIIGAPIAPWANLLRKQEQLIQHITVRS